MSGSFEEFITGGKVKPFHIHDIGHKIKNAEALLERGTNFDGRNTYESIKIASCCSRFSGGTKISKAECWYVS